MGTSSCGRMTWTPLKSFGVEVTFDLRQSLTDVETEAFIALFNEYDLLLFRGQSLNRDRQMAIAGLVGPPTTVPRNQYFITNENPDDVAQNIELTHHSDYAWAPLPLTAISLHAIVVVDGESATKFANSANAYKTLPEATKARLKNIDADMVATVTAMLNTPAMEQDPGGFPLHERRRVVKVNERTGNRYLLVNEQQTAGLLDLPTNEGRALLKELFAHLYSSINTFEHAWYRGDMVLWDNRNVQYARRDVRRIGKRILQRVSVGPDLSEQYPNVEKGRHVTAPSH